MTKRVKYSAPVVPTYVKDGMTFSHGNNIRVDKRPEDGRLYEDCACLIWHENLKLLGTYREDTSLVLTVGDDNIIQLLDVHCSFTDLKRPKLHCPDCNSTETGWSKYGGMEYEPGYMCHECGYHGASNEEWKEYSIT
jgi:hypothetical protein